MFNSLCAAVTLMTTPVVENPVDIARESLFLDRVVLFNSNGQGEIYDPSKPRFQFMLYMADLDGDMGTIEEYGFIMEDDLENEFILIKHRVIEGFESFSSLDFGSGSELVNRYDMEPIDSFWRVHRLYS